MSEINISISLEVVSESHAIKLANELKDAEKKYNSDLTKTISSLHKIENDDKYEEVFIEEIACKNNTINIVALSGRIDPLTWIASALKKLGSKKIAIYCQYDEGGEALYFLEGKKVSRKKYNNNGTSNKELSIDNSGLFLSEDRVFVRATLISHKNLESSGKKKLMKFVTDKKQTFYYKGQGELTEVASDDWGNLTEFRASFEKGKLEGEEVSFAKRPTQIHYQRGINSAAQCPFCGSSLRSEKAKQCPSCFKSWRDNT